MSDLAYPYRVPMQRSSNWYPDRWRELSAWCDECVGPGEWEYYNSEFVFAKEADSMLFKLRWL